MLDRMQIDAQVATSLDRSLEQILSNVVEGKSVFFLRAQAIPQLRNAHITRLECNQSFKPAADMISSAGLPSTLEWPQEKFDLALYLPTRFKDENLFNFSRLAELLKPQGVLISAAHNKLGARSYEKSLKKLFGQVESFSAQHCRVTLATMGAGFDFALREEWRKLGLLRMVEGTSLFTNAACFSADRVDAASLLLSELLPKEIGARGADLGAGYGYLSEYVLRYCSSVQELHLYEAEHEALVCAQKNLSASLKDIKLSFNWHDVSKGIPLRDLDWIVMNPPLHELNRAKLGLGVKFVEAAHAALKRDGTLYLVFNQHLPYPPLLGELFRSCKVLGEDRSFVVMAAKK